MGYSKHALARSAMKVAEPSWGQAFQKAKMSPEFLGAVGSAGVGLGVTGIMAAGAKLKEMYDRNKSFKEMLSLTPALREANQDDVKRYFNSLHRMNPHFMNDPMIAGAHVHRVIESQQSLGGAGQPAMALATMAGELAKGRSDFTAALQREHGMKPDYARHLAPIVEKGIVETGKELQGMSPGALQLKEIEAAQKHLDDTLGVARFEEGQRKRRAQLEQAVSRHKQMEERAAQAEGRARGFEMKGREAEERYNRFQQAFSERPSLGKTLAARLGQSGKSPTP